MKESSPFKPKRKDLNPQPPSNFDFYQQTGIPNIRHEFDQILNSFAKHR